LFVMTPKDLKKLIAAGESQTVEYGLAAPEFKEVGESFLVTVFKKRLSGHIQKAVREGLVDGLVDGLVESQKKILVLMQATPKISKKDLAAAVGISATAIDKNIAVLKARSLLRRIGPDKGGHWEVLSQ